MKRSPSSSPTPDLGDKLPTPPSTPRKKAKISQSQSDDSPQGKKPSGWTPEKKQAVVDILITAGLQSTKLDDIAKQVGVTKQQLRDATQKGKPNLRHKVIKAAGGC